MAQRQDKGIQGFAGGVGALSLFILINGFVIAALAFVTLLHETADQKNIEARNATREIVYAATQTASDVEKSLRALGQLYSAMRGTPDVSARSLLVADTGPDAVLWTTERGSVWRRENLITGEARSAFDAASGWPSYPQIAKDIPGLRVGELTYLSRLRWPAFSASAEAAAEQPAGLALKLRTADGGMGILLAVIKPSRIFGKDWTAPHEGILRITVTDHSTGSTLVDSAAPQAGAERGLFFAPVPVTYGLQLGDRVWDIKFTVMPMGAARFLAAAPWAALFFIGFLTVIAAALAERKHRQDRRIEEMSKTLAASHHELQTKTTERDQLFYALRRSEREYKAVINSVSDVIFETDETGRIIFLNETWKRITDSDTAEFTGRSLFDAIIPPDRMMQQEMFEDLVRGRRQSYRTETTLDLGRGRMRAVEIAFSMLRMTEDKNIRVVGTITDIEKRRRAEVALRETEQRYRGIVENAISGIYQTSPEGRFVSANPALAEILGYASQGELIHSVTDIAKQVYVNPADREAFVQTLLFEGRVSSLESEVYRKDGSKIWIMENARVVRSDRGAILYYEGSISDVTERKGVEGAMHHARLQAEISSRSRMEFLANMSHELRTPLNTIIGFSEIIKDEVVGPIGTPAYKEYSQDIFDSGNYLLKVISEILEVSKIETGNRELNVSNFRLPKALRSCVTIMAARAEQAGVEVRVSAPEDLPEFLGEELGFKQIMLNLIGNAIKFTNKGGRVTVAARVLDNGELLVDVADTGIGMNADEIRKAMQPFAKVDNNFSTMKEGMGLGLTIVESLVRLHGGRFELLSRKGEGTQARVFMPATRVLRESNVTPLKISK